MEIFDICDENGLPTGETVERNSAHAEGILHRTAHVWVIRKNFDRYQVLLQKRAMNKDSFPGRFDTSSAGHIHAGDEPLSSAIRELSEELGIFAEESDLTFIGTIRVKYEKEFHGKLFKDNEIAFVHIYQNDVDIENLTLQEEEIDSVAWFDIEEVYYGCKEHNQIFCVPIKGLELVIKYLNLILH